MAVEVAGSARSVRSEFGSNLRGQVICPDDSGYDAARAVFNGMIDRRPLAVVRSEHVSDVIRCIEFAGRHEVPLTVRGGGHSVAGHAVRDGAVMLDLSGIAGLTLGGGLGWLNGRYGLACDNLISADVATADGRLLMASRQANEDLFWGIRGGGGNFGVVTSFEYQLHPVDLVLAGGLSYPLSMAPEVLGFYDEFVRASPDELSTAVSFALAQNGEPTVTIVVCYCGPIDEGKEVLHPLRTRQSPVDDGVQPMPYPVLQSARDEAFPSGRLHYWRSGWLRNLTSGAIETLLRFLPHMPSPASGVSLQQMHGAASRVAPSATAFPHRAEQYDFLILSQWSDATDSNRNIEWTQEFFHAMRPYLDGSVYVNNLGDEGPNRVREAYGENYDRLASLKRTYDPDNLFRANQNIVPSRQ